jgi:hypothetical protein
MRAEIAKTSTVVAAKDQVSCDLAGEAVILNLKSGIYYGLNPVAARVWSLIQRARDRRKGQWHDECRPCASIRVRTIRAPTLQTPQKKPHGVITPMVLSV